MFIYEDMPGFPVMVVDWDIPFKRVKSFLNIISFSLTTNLSPTTLLAKPVTGMKKYWVSCFFFILE